MKNVTLGQFFPGDSFLYKLDPRAKLLMAIALIVLVFIIKGFAKNSSASGSGRFLQKPFTSSPVMCAQSALEPPLPHRSSLPPALKQSISRLATCSNVVSLRSVMHISFLCQSSQPNGSGSA